MSDYNFVDADTALLIMEELTSIILRENGEDSVFVKRREESGIQEERNSILTHAAPALNAAYDQNEGLSNCCFDMEIVPTVLERIALNEKGLASNAAVWNDAYRFAYLVHEKNLSIDDAESEVTKNPTVMA